MSQYLGYYKISDNAYAPEKGSLLAAGFDLKSAYNYVVPAHGKQLIKTDLTFQLPENTYGRIAPRSGLALNSFIDVGAGVIDRDYTGNVSVLLFNHSNIDFSVLKGDKIAQLICEVIVQPKLIEINSLLQTERVENHQSSQWGIDEAAVHSFLSSGELVQPSTSSAPVPKSVSTRGGKSKKNTSPQGKLNPNDGYSLKSVVELLILLGLTSATKWERVMFEIKHNVSNLMNTELTNLYFALKMVVQAVCAGVVQSSDLSQEKFEAINDLEREHNELMTYIEPTLNLIPQTVVYSKECVTYIKDFVVTAMKNIDEPSPKKQKQSEEDNTDTTEVMRDLFSGLFDGKKKKAKDVVINQQFALRDEDVVRKFSTPGEKGKFLVKIEITDCDDLKGVSVAQYWTKVWKKAIFLLDNEDDPTFKTINSILLKKLKEIAEIKDVQMTEFDVQEDKSGNARKRPRFGRS